ncbi:MULTISPECIES: hypothetical protein [Staphylococcus]|uniref:hypothetical protein n=1 Tax=Staphylococcus TaxID=1279 RepID=UPI0008A1D2C0|nr:MULTISPECIES: hypothetical protein [Staphylococcus]RNM25133.1 hypothetical protein EFY80_10860 [Staphylococcus cohnii]MBL0384814.1 hypothetical protein [Staphylococcus sp. S59]MBL0402325.1 hypothetical protein [Staphylococcus sp. S36]MDU9372291.1 hypothetical protein [Staphylococcus ureilyticus]OFQ87353.1 hypothetical protein HMPREF2913_03640 [Staphylococcus sp. HMSC065A08]
MESLLDKKIYMNQKFEFETLKVLSKELSIKPYLYELDENNILKNEKNIEKFYNEIRTLWLQKNFETQVELYKSPVQYTLEDRLKFNEYEYERIINKNGLENYYHEDLKNYYKKTFFYNSGMGAISNTMYIIKNLFSKSIKGIKDIGYFETKNFFETIKRLNISTSENGSINEFVDFYFFEPIQYNFQQLSTNYIETIDRIKNNNYILFIIIDISLFGDVFPFNDLRNKYKDSPNIIFIIVESLLKLNQQGLELTNAGRATWYIPKENSKLYESICKLAKIISDTNGSHLLDFNSRVLNNHNFLFNEDYASTILSNNKDFYNEIKNISNQVIKRVIHRNNDKDSQLTMPFIFIKLQINTEKFCEIFLAYIRFEFSNLGLSVDVRDSFGFRNLSVQYFVDRASGEAIFKIAIGHFKGFKYWALLNVIKKTSSYKNVKEFEKQFEVDK